MGRPQEMGLTLRVAEKGRASAWQRREDVEVVSGLWRVAEEEDGCFYCSVEKSSQVWKNPGSLLNPVFSFTF